MDISNLDESVKLALRVAKNLAVEYGNASFSAGHLLKGLLNKEVGLNSFIQSLGVDLKFLNEWAEVRIEDYPKGNAEEIVADEKIQNLLEAADVVRLKLGWLEISSVCLLYALSRPGVGFPAEQLKTFPIREKSIMDKLLNEDELQRSIQPSSAESSPGLPNSTLLKYCIDKNELVAGKKLHPVVRREKEIRTMAEILSRYSRPNVMITGEAGVGKTAIVDGLVCDIMTGNTPPHLENAIVFELDMGALVAGATYKGEVEERLKSIIKEIRKIDKSILFIDEIHLLFDARSGNPGAANILKQELSKGELMVIGSTTTEEYRKWIEPDHTFSRRFEEIHLTEPDTSSAIAIMKEVHARYADHHQLQASDEALVACVRFAKRYVKDRKLPDAAIDLLDRTMAAVKIINQTTAADLQKLTEQLEAIKTAPDMDYQQKEDSLHSLQFTMQNLLNPILLGMITEEQDEEKETLQTAISRMEKGLLTIGGYISQPISVITGQEVASIIAAKTGIPVGKIQSEEKERLMNMESVLRRRVVGQNHALKVLSDAIVESRSGMNKPGQPIGSFFLLGPTGTGKTELAKALAELLFNDEKAMIRFDMSEFKEEHSAALLYGAPPGYVGYEEGGLLVNKIRRQPYSVVLFDEIEKAHQSVYDVFLQIMDEGKLHDKLGKEGDFSNAVILFTSNVGSEWLAEQVAEGKNPSIHQLMDRVGQYFRPEFLARLSEIVPFAPVDEVMLMQIFNIRLKEFESLLASQGISIELTPEVVSLLASMDFNPKYGARQIAGTIRNRLRRPISRLIVGGEIGKGTTIKITVGKEKELVWEYINVN